MLKHPSSYEFSVDPNAVISGFIRISGSAAESSKFISITNNSLLIPTCGPARPSL